MKVEQIYTGCLAEAAYYIESKGEVAIIDPLRETAPYIEKAKENNAQIKYIFETHFHADFVSGHVDLAKETGAKIVFGPSAKAGYDIYEAKANEIFELGDVKIKVLHTPGHTMESSSFLLIDENGKEHAIFSGDTLFLGDVGRPDLAVKSDLSKEDLAEKLFDSLRNEIMTLADDVIVYPGHGAGSACGKNMSEETVGTIGHEKATNYALRADMTKEEFVEEVLKGILPPPQYFGKNAMLNKNGYQNFNNVLEKGNVALDAEAFKAKAEHEDALILDVRDEIAFANEHIPNSIFIGLDGDFAPWVGALITSLEQPILLVCPEGREEEAVTRLARVGYDNTLGYLEGGLEIWKKAGYETASINSVSATEVAVLVKDNIHILDVRKSSEYLSEHVVGAENIPLDYINSNMDKVDNQKHYYIHCAGGYRSIVFSSILKARGYDNFTNVEGGFDALKETSIDVTDYVCPSTL